MAEVTFSASFRIMGGDLEPSEVSRCLALEPDEAHRAGDPRPSSSGRTYSAYSEGLWSLDSGIDPRMPPGDHAAGLLARLEGRGQALRQIKESGYEIDLFVGVFGNGTGNLGFSVDSKTMMALAELGIALEVDVYG